LLLLFLLLLLLTPPVVLLENLVFVLIVLHTDVISIVPSPPHTITITITLFNTLTPPPPTRFTHLLVGSCTVILVLIFDSLVLHTYWFHRTTRPTSLMMEDRKQMIYIPLGNL
jgi:hypothetical protein